MPKIYLLDVTKRDGVQTARISLAKLQQIIVNLLLNDSHSLWADPQRRINQ